MDFTKNFICCVLVESYAVDNNISCIIQAIKQGSCSSYQVESPNEISNNVSVAHLPRNQILCFVAEAKNLTSTVTLMESFSTSTGCNHIMPVLNSIVTLNAFVCYRSYSSTNHCYFVRYCCSNSYIYCYNFCHSGVHYTQEKASEKKHSSKVS